MLYYYQKTHYLPSGPPQTFITDEDIAKSRDLRHLVKLLGPSIRTFQPRDKKYYSYHVYEEIDISLLLLEIVYSENELNAEEIRTRIRPGNDTEVIRELTPPSLLDYRMLWETTQTELRLWTAHRHKWQQEKHCVDGENIIISFQRQFDQRIEARPEFLIVFDQASAEEYNPRRYTKLYNWLGHWRCFTGLAIGDDYGYEKKLLSLWNVEHFLANWDYDNWFDLDDDIYWARKVGVELARILNLEWEDRLVKCTEKK